LIEKARRQGGKYLNPVPTAVGSLSLMPKILWHYLTSKSERTPIRSLGPFRTDAQVYAIPPASGLRVTWMGHSSTLLEIDGFRILLDPVWAERAGPFNWAGPRRFFPAPLALEQMPHIDVVVLSHDHYDHFDAQTIRKLARLPAFADARWVTTLGVGKLLKRYGVNPDRVSELDWTESLQVDSPQVGSPQAGSAETGSPQIGSPPVDSPQSGSLTLTALPARHFSGRGIRDRFTTLWASFVIAGPTHRVYYGADSGEWPGYIDIGRQYGPFDLTMLEIGASDVLWADIHMGPDGAFRSFQTLGATGLLMPIHWGLFDLALHAWRQPIERIFSFANLKLFSPQPGLPTEVVKGREVRSEWWR
jgi:L-ascorbate metabolism protein UlaG (beta-lactamase superfamily)